MYSPFPLSLRERLLGEAVQCHDRHLAIQSRRELIQTLGPDGAFAWAEVNGTASILGHDFSGAGLEDTGIRDKRSNKFGSADPPLTRFQTAHLATANRIGSYLEELDAVAYDLAHAGISAVALKNSGIVRGIYPCTGCSPMGDLDLLIRPRDFRAAHAILLQRGFTFKFRSELEEENLDHAEASGGSEYFRTLPNGEKLWLELQWRPIAGRWIRPDQEPSADDLLDRSQEVLNTHIRILAPLDNLLQVALHTAKHSYVRAPGYRLHTDIDRIVAHCTIDWDQFIQRAKQSRVCTAVYFSLAIARELLQTPIPTDALTAIRPSHWKESCLRNWLQHAGLFYPDQHKFSRTRFLAFNACLYDDAMGLARAIFPTPRWMRERYHCSTLAIPWYYLRRMSDLLRRRSPV
jgi:Uncharacterised nucleotidyltransferase